MRVPDVYDALVASWTTIRDQLGLDGSQIFDGPAVSYAGSEGIAVGATATDTTAEFELGAGALDSDAEHTTIPCLAWAGHGDTTFTTIRGRVKAMLAVVRTDLARDNHPIYGVVSSAWITGGTFIQDQTRDERGIYRGALVTCEFRIEYDIF